MQILLTKGPYGTRASKMEAAERDKMLAAGEIAHLQGPFYARKDMRAIEPTQRLPWETDQPPAAESPARKKPGPKPKTAT